MGDLTVLMVWLVVGEGYFWLDGVWIFAVKWEDYRKVYRKIFGDFYVIWYFFISVMGK